jgi:hypothetical protein
LPRTSRRTTATSHGCNCSHRLTRNGSARLGFLFRWGARASGRRLRPPH